MVAPHVTVAVALRPAGPPAASSGAGPTTPALTSPPGSLRAWVFEILFDFCLIVVGVFLFFLAFPNPIAVNGFGIVGFVALVPVFWLLQRVGWIRAVVYGPIVGFFTYALFNYWLANFHPLAVFIVPTIYATYYLLLFPVLKLAVVAFPRYGFLVQTIVWVAYEYLRIQGFLGYAYGIIGYTQYRFVPLVNVAALTGVWGPSLLLVFPAAFVAHLIARSVGGPGTVSGGSAEEPSAGIATRTGVARRWVIAVRRLVLPDRFAAVVWGVYATVLSAAIVYGVAAQVDYQAVPTRRIAMIQQNVDPWIGGIRAYRRSMDALLRQSDLALQRRPDLVVWSETSFIPAIDYHTRFRGSPESFDLVRELTDYLNAQSVPFVLGNGDGQLVPDGNGNLVREDYNAVILHRDGAYREIYRKLHLVPFTEHFPYEKQFPWLHRLLVENNTTFWQHGDEYVIFEAAGLRFGTPICFEDTFGYLVRNFVRAGAEMIVNLTNDSWSKSVPAATQHMAMAVFRAAEVRRSVVRSTNGGMTVVIDPNGRIIADLPAFIEGHLVADVPVFVGAPTPYVLWGDWLAWAALIVAAVLVLVAPVRMVIMRRQRADTAARCN